MKEKAEKRVADDPELSIRRGVLIDYDWNDPSHFEWVATAPKSELLSWAKEVDECSRCGRRIERTEYADTDLCQECEE
jgi:NADH pyrophosphatase NudC (nudix superfamily)